jgi:hypothetical protein
VRNLRRFNSVLGETSGGPCCGLLGAQCLDRLTLILGIELGSVCSDANGLLRLNETCLEILLEKFLFARDTL